VSDELAALVAVPLDVEVGGKRYRFSPLSIRQNAALRVWARSVPFERFREQIKLLGDVTKEERAQLFARACADSEDEKKIAAIVDGQEGIAKAFELMLRANHPDLTDAEVSALFTVEIEARVWRWLTAVTLPTVGAKEVKQPKKDGGDGVPK
jgi:hypothetical protein